MRRRSPRRAMPIFSTIRCARRPSARPPSSPASRPPRSCRSRGRAVKDDVASALKKAARRGVVETAASRQPARWPDLLTYKDRLDANASVACARKNWSMWEGLLVRGSEREEGIHLTQAECWTLLQLLRDGRPRPRGRRPLKEYEAKQIAAYSMLLEADGLLPKAAIADTEQLYNVGL